MLQRIQSVWMLLAAVCAALTFKFPFYSGNKLIGANGHLYQSLTASNNILITIITAAIIVGSLINIFNYKARKKQLLGTIGLMIVSLINIILYYRASKEFILGDGNFSLTSVLSLIIPIFFILAARGIMRDEKLVKSADRLR